MGYLGRMAGVLVGLGVLLGTGAAASRAVHRPEVLAAAAGREFGGGATLPTETIEVAKRHGLDYGRVVRAAGKGDVAACGG